MQRPRGIAAQRAYLTARITDVATIERLTGADFFPGDRQPPAKARALW